MRPGLNYGKVNEMLMVFGMIGRQMELESQKNMPSRDMPAFDCFDSTTTRGRQARSVNRPVVPIYLKKLQVISD